MSKKNTTAVGSSLASLSFFICYVFFLMTTLFFGGHLIWRVCLTLFCANCIWMIYQKKSVVYMSKRLWMFLLLSIGCIGLQAMNNRMEANFDVTQFGLVFLLIFLLENEDKYIAVDSLHIADELFYFLLILGTGYSMLFANEIHEGSMSFLSLGDPNWTGVLMFFLFAYSWKAKRAIGLIMSVIYILFFTASRGLFLMLLCFFVCILARGIVNGILRFPLFNKIWKLNAISLLAVLFFSSYWILSIAVGNLSDYREGFNDKSNKTRFTANVYAMTQIYDNDTLWVSGYDNQLLTVLGIDESIDESLRTTENGVSLVQPHNGMINLFLRMGVLPACLNVYMMSMLLDKLRNRNNIELIIPVIINAAFLHLYLISWFMLWFFVLYMTQRVRHKAFSV